MNKTVLTLLGTVRESYDYVLIDLPPLDLSLIHISEPTRPY